MPPTRPFEFAASRATPTDDRLSIIKALGESKTPAAIDSLLSMLTDDSSDPIKIAALSALGYFTDEHIADVVLHRFSTLSARSQARSIELLCSRPSWALKLAESIDRKTIPAEAVSRELVQRLRQYDDQRLIKLIEKNWGKVRAVTPFETQGRINAVLQLLSKRPGDAARGRPYFEKTCATCHKLHGSGAAVGPDLTGAERKNRELLVQNIVDPSAVIRQEFTVACRGDEGRTNRHRAPGRIDGRHDHAGRFQESAYRAQTQRSRRSSKSPPYR